MKQYNLFVDTATKLPYLREIRDFQLCCNDLDKLDNPEKVYNFMCMHYESDNLAEEYGYAIAVDNKTKVLGVFEISHGAVNQSILNPREVFIRLLLCGASKFILVHNHPSGDTHPSSEDITTTDRFKEAGKLVGVELLDHVIIGDTYFSFKQEKYL